MLSDKYNQLFDELKWYTDEPKIMHEFIECLKHWVIFHNKGNIKVCLINLHEIDNNFSDADLSVAYNDCGGAMDTIILPAWKFIDLIYEINLDYEWQDVLHLTWVDYLEEILTPDEN